MDPETLRAQLDLLQEENEQLRTEYTRARQSQYQRTALGLGGIGVLASLGGLLFPSAQTVLFALGGTGAFLAVLMYYLTPEQFLPASLGRTVYSALASNEAAIATELGLREERVYVPTDTDGVRLFVPQHAEYAIPDDEELTDVFVVTDDADPRGISLEPTGDGLADEFDRAVTGDSATEPGTIAEQASDALVEQFELLDSATPDVDPDGGRLTVAVSESAYGDIERFYHPVVSVLASITARQLSTPVTAEIETVPEGNASYRITLTWATDDVTGADTTDETSETEAE